MGVCVWCIVRIVSILFEGLEFSRLIVALLVPLLSVGH